MNGAGHYAPRNDPRVRDARADATEDQRKAQFAAAKERCDELAGAAKDRCIADAKVRYSIN